MNTFSNRYYILASNIAPNPKEVKYWADLASNPNGGDLKYFNGTDWVYVNAKATGDIAELQGEVSTLKTEVSTLKTTVANKVDKISGKGLSTNDYTTTEKNKLAGLSNYDDTEVRNLITSLTSRVTALESVAA